MGTQDKVPDAIAKRHKVISLSEGNATFTVTRWSIAKTMMMAGWMATALKDIPGIGEAKQFEGLTPLEIGIQMATQLGDKFIEFLGLSVDPVDKATVLDLAADDGLEVFQAIFELNVTDKLLKKVAELSGLFRSRFPGSLKPKST